ncbi:MAG: hypothetical protein QM774_00495 [Gordonia sp. (in: high G+C Gram-positive bacteria)]|uniref:hypothetical protein n=1 Tax=Gordonia sp. (in: high G+C Gram-positive bacteria) TaxID=84139 RepID=UPI0039E66510
MSAAIEYESESTVVTTDAESRLQLDEPDTDYVKIVETDGTIRLIPVALLHESERAILEDEDLYAQTKLGLGAFEAGERVSSDWLFDKE